MKTKISTEVAHVTRDSDTFKVKMSKVKVTMAALLTAVLAGRGGCSGIVGAYVLAVGNCCHVAVCSAAQGALRRLYRGTRGGHIVAAARLQLVN